MTTFKLLEMAMDTEDAPHLIHPEKKRKINAGEHPLAKNPAYPEGNYGEKIATQAYGKVLKGVRSAGKNPARLSHRQVFQELMATLHRIIDIESDHRAELEELAVSIVLDLPEFKDARRAYVAGHIRINARLLPEMPAEMHDKNMQRIDPSDEGGEELGMDVPEIGKQLDLEVAKRQFVNMLIQGAGVVKTHAYHLASERLQQLDPDLLKHYGLLVALGDLSYWMKPEDVFGGKHGGEASIEIEDEDDVYVVNATAINFPLLIQELVKGLYEVVVHNVTEDPGVRQHVYHRADTLADEEWHIMKGPAVWTHFNHLVNKAGGSDYIPRILNYIVSLSASEFSSVVRGILSETPESLKYLRELVASIKQEVDAEDAEEESDQE